MQPATHYKHVDLLPILLQPSLSHTNQLPIPALLVFLTISQGDNMTQYKLAFPLTMLQTDFLLAYRRQFLLILMLKHVVENYLLDLQLNIP